MTGDDRKTILLVEDEFLIAASTKASLERSGYAVLHAGSGEKAVEMARRGTPIDLILMDIDLGCGMDGTEAAASILSLEEKPVVFL
ncbi:MAG: response regulator [Spirochaetota bacterium]